jgi:Protein kinase domain
VTCAHGAAGNCPACLLEVGIADQPLPAGIVAGGRFRIVERLGRGGMGEVYRADDLKLGHAVALKFVDAGETTLREVRVGREIAHPNVCRVYDIVDVDNEPAIVMELVEGEDLAALLARGTPPRARALEIARDVCAGLDAIHEKGIAHGDLKPANVMIDARGRARITDFGLASRGGEAGRFGGTPAYMAPERAATPRADLYSLGVMLAELLPADLPVLRRCVDPDPARRPASPRAVLAAIEDEEPLAAVRAAPLTVVQASIAAVLTVALLAAAWLLPRAAPPAQPRGLHGTAYVIVLTAALAAGVVLALLNLRARRVDLRTATRTAVIVFVCRAVAALLVAARPATLDAASALGSSVIAASLFLAAEVWLAYVALEPFVRRALPDALVSWARLVRGRLRDGIVPRDLLLGLLGGAAMRLGVPAPLPFPYSLAMAVFYALFALLLLVLLRAVVRLPWLAGGLWLAAVTAAWSAAPGDVVLVAAQMLVVLILLHRLGLLAATAAIALFLV